MISECIIKLDKVRKVYRMGDERIVALDDICYEFEKEKIYCLLGPSGSGKSTLLNMLAGLEKPSKGTIMFNGSRLEALSEKELALFRQRHIGFVFQQYNLLPTLTATENVTLPLIFHRVPKRKREALAKKMLTSVGLGERLKHKPDQMSGGQQQRVSIARAFINNPQVVFADEPTGNLDTKTTAEMMNLIVGFAKQYKQTLIIVTHNVELSQYADHVIHMLDGRIQRATDKAPEHEGEAQ